MKLSITSFILFVLFWVTSFTLSAQITQIRGIVKDQKGNLINEVKITTPEGQTYSTNKIGKFVFSYNVPMRGAIPQFVFSKSGFDNYVWEYDKIDNKTIILNKKNYVVKQITGKLLTAQNIPASKAKIYNSSGLKKRTNEQGEFNFELKIPLPTTNKPYDGSSDFKNFGISQVTFLNKDQLINKNFYHNKDYKKILVTLPATTQPQQSAQRVESSNPAASKTFSIEHDTIDHIDENLDELVTSNEDLEELKSYINYLETVLDSANIHYSAQKLGQDSSLHATIKSKLIELKNKVAEKEQEVKAEKQKNLYLWIILLITVLILIPTVLAIIFYRNNKKTGMLNEELDDQNKKLKSAYHQIHSSVVYAQRIQQSILVKPNNIKTHFKDAMVFFKPKDIVSGDFYWFGQVDNRLIIAAVDCTGHGVPGAFMTMMGNSILNETVMERKITDPAQILSELHLKIQTALKTAGDSASNDGMDIALTCVDSTDKTVTFAGANNPLYYISDKNFNTIKGDRFGLGGTKSDSTLSIQQHTFDCSEIETFYLVSDGFQDQFGGAQNRKFMKKRFKNLLLELSPKPFEEQEKILEKELATWKGNQDQTDDILIVGVKV